MPQYKIAAMLTLSALITGFGLQTQAQPLKGYSWKYRLLIIYAPTASSPALIRQRSIVNANIAGFRDRDMVVVEVVGNNVRSKLGPRVGVSAMTLRSYYGVGKHQFRAILIGKDGGQKLRNASAISSGKLFQLIDSMPMRREEMRRRGQ